MWTLAQDAAAAAPAQSHWGEVISNLTSTGSITIMLIFGIPIVAILVGGMKAILTARAQERTRQEVAAYVAEGSMTAEEGERLLRAGGSRCD
ncbi:MAG: hypothetical protein VX726_13730 [Planctomycetota bacterium]|nr:hypothetical protein [Planctomycetota bacterium]